MKFETLRKTLTVTAYVIKVVYYEGEEAKVTRYNIDYLWESVETFTETVHLLNSLNPLSVKFVGTADGLLEITLEM